MQDVTKLMGEQLEECVNPFRHELATKVTIDAIKAAVEDKLQSFVVLRYLARYHTYKTDLDPTLPDHLAWAKKKAQSTFVYIVSDVEMYYPIGSPTLRFVLAIDCGG